MLDRRPRRAARRARGPKPCDTAAIDEAFGSYDVRSWVFYTDHVARITVTAIDGGRHPPDGEFPVVHFDIDEVYSGAPALPRPRPTCSPATSTPSGSWVARTSPRSSGSHDGGPIHWLPIGHGALMTYAAGVLAASTWTDALVGDGAVYVARVDGRVAWVVQRPRWAGLDEQLVVVLHPDGTWWQALG